METHQTLYQNENRAISLTVLDKDKTAFTDMSTVTYTVENSSGTVVVTQLSATISTNTITAIISTVVTATVGDYFIVWKITDSNGYIYYHKTAIEVIDI
jgi:hypothetical protein